MIEPFEALLFVLLLLSSVAVMYLEDLFAAAMITAIFSLISACLYTLMDAVDVAFTEAAVGAGISTVLILGTISLTTHKEHQQRLRVWPMVAVALTGAALIYGTLDMPAFGSPDAVIHHHVAPHYIEGASSEFSGIPNIVTILLASYRGYDTLGETTVIFTATIGVMLLLGTLKRKKARPANNPAPAPTPDDDYLASPKQMQDFTILKVVCTALIPFILLYALYVQFHGDFGPGGGFQAGVIFGTGLILFGLVFGLRPMHKVAPSRWLEIGMVVGLVLYAGTGMVSLLMGGNFLDYAVFDAHSAQHGRHVGILLVEGGVGITVTCAMTLIFYSVAGRTHARGQGESGGPG